MGFPAVFSLYLTAGSLLGMFYTPASRRPFINHLPPGHACPARLKRSSAPAEAETMSFLASAQSLFREAKDTLVTVNRMVADVDPLYVRLTWASSAVGSLRQLGLFTLVGGLLGHVMTNVTIDWTTVLAGWPAPLLYPPAAATGAHPPPPAA